MNYKEIRNSIVKRLHEYLQSPVVPTDNNQKKPDYPFVSYKFTTIFRGQGGHNRITDMIPSDDPNFEYDIEVTHQEQPQMVLSVSTYSLDEVEAYELAIKAKNWFRFQGRDYLKANNIVVVGTSTIQDRTIHIVDNYEKRAGFDITLRTVSEQKMVIETIETMKMEGNSI
jgi:hypothetical protein